MSLITSVTKFKFVLCLILVEGTLCVQNQGIAIGNNTTEKSRSETNTTNSNGFDTSGSIRPVMNSTDRVGPQRKDSNTRSPAPVQESGESEDHKEYIFENDSIHETVNSVHEVDQHPATISSQEIHIPETLQENVRFRPSMHLGQIGEINFTGTIMNPFNKMQHVGFENVVNPKGNLETHQQSVRHKLVKFYDTNNEYKLESVKVPPIQLSEYLHNLHNLQSNQHHKNQFAEADYAHRTLNHDMKIIQGVLSMKPMTFERGNYNLGITEKPYQYVNVEKPYDYVNVEKPYHYVNIEKPHHYVNVDKPYHAVKVEKPYHLSFEKYVNFPNGEKFVHPYAQNYEYVQPFQSEYNQKPECEFEEFKKPELDVGYFKKPELGFKNPQLDLEHFKNSQLDFEHYKKPEISVDYLQPVLHGNFENFRKPENVVYVTTHEATFTRSKKFPYQFHHPTFGSEMLVLPEDNSHEFVTHEKRVSPWKKIFHLLGAAIPLGLLFAALTPRMHNIDQENITEPNIILSKLRSGSLPAEHKEGRTSDNPHTCEERSICEMILGGAKAKSNLIQNILWNLSNRITNEFAKKNGVQDIFFAVKRKDCGSLTC